MGEGDLRVEEDVYDVDCPHCKKRFRGALLSGAAPRYQGFKCRHCRLFIPLERVEEQFVPEAPPQVSPSA